MTKKKKTLCQKFFLLKNAVNPVYRDLDRTLYGKFPGIVSVDRQDKVFFMIIISIFNVLN